MKRFLSGDEALAEGVRLARPQVISAYPITPQTVVVERLSEMVEDGSLAAEYVHVESEHSALSCAIGASATGARTFTATSSQGLLYMAECLTYAAGGRFPIVMMNANRALALPWNIYGDQRDSLSLLDHGWIQVYAENNQEALDLALMAYAVAEDPAVRTPVMVNLDGFVLTHTYELLHTVDQDKVDAYIPYQQFANRMDLDNPKATCITAGPLYNMEFRYQQHQAMLNAVEKIKAADKAFGETFGRSYGGAVEEYRCDDADYVIVTMGSMTGVAKDRVDKARADGKKVGLLKMRMVRPFPCDRVAKVLSGKRAFGVVDRNVSFGWNTGIIYEEICASMNRAASFVPNVPFIAGLGGEDITATHIDYAIDKIIAQDGKTGKHDTVWLNREVMGL